MGITKLVLLLTGLSLAAASYAGHKRQLPLAFLTMDGIHTTASGNTLAADGFDGSRIYLIKASGSTRVLAEGLNGPIDITQGPNGDLFVTNFNSASVSRVTAAGEVSHFADVLPGPSGITSDPAGNLYVSHFGPGAGGGDTVLKISPAGEVSVFSQGGELNTPIGTAIDEFGNLYTANFNNGVILKISPDGEQEVLAQVPSDAGFAIGHLAYANGFLYATGLIDKALYILKPNGKLKRKNVIPEGLFPNGIAVDTANQRVLIANVFAPVASLTQVRLRGVDRDDDDDDEQDDD